MTATATDPVVAEVVKTFESTLGKKLDEFNAEQKANVQKAVDERFAQLQADFEAKYARQSLAGSAEETHKGKKYSMARALAYVATRDASIAPMEVAMHEDLRKSKAMSFANDSAGGFLVPNEVAVAQLIPLLYAKSVVMDLGATSLNGLTTAPFQIPRVSGGTTAYWVAEAGTITDSSLATQMLSLSPHGLAALTLVSDLIQHLDNPGVEQMVLADQARQLALALDLKAMRGTGASNTPVGVINVSGVNASAVSATPTYDELSDAIAALQEDNALEGNLGWALAHADMQLIRKMKDAQVANTNVVYQPLGPRALIGRDAQGNETLLGYKARVSTQLTTGDVIFGNWADLIVAQWGGLRVDMTNALGFATAQTHIRTLTYADVGVRHAVSFNVG